MFYDFVLGYETPSAMPALRLNSLTLQVFKEAKQQRQVNYVPEPKCFRIIRNTYHTLFS